MEEIWVPSCSRTAPRPSRMPCRRRTSPTCSAWAPSSVQARSSRSRKAATGKAGRKTRSPFVQDNGCTKGDLFCIRGCAPDRSGRSRDACDVQAALADLHTAVLERDEGRKRHLLPVGGRDLDRHVRKNIADVAADHERAAVRLLIKDRAGLREHIVAQQAHGRVRVARDDEIKVPVRDVVHRQLLAAKIRLPEEIQIRRCLIAEVGCGVELPVRIRQSAQRVGRRRRRGRRLRCGGL